MQEVNFLAFKKGTTGVADVAFADEESSVDVYSVSGVRVRSGVKVAGALDGLPKGIYIVNGKKILKYLKSATPFPKCYLHKEKWTFDS